MKTTKQNIVMFAAAFAALSILGCSLKTSKPLADVDAIPSYRAIPGVTAEEIAAVEALISSHDHFSYGSLYSTEAFVRQDGTSAGFSIMFPDLLSNLFGVPFVQEFSPRESLATSIDNNTIDFTSDISSTIETMQQYFMTNPVAGRSIGLFLHGDPDRFTNEKDLAGHRVGFFADTATTLSILRVYPLLNFEVVDVQGVQESVENLRAGVVDAVITEGNMAYAFSNYPDIFHKEIFPLAYTPVRLITANPDLAPIISVVNKYIEAGGIDKLEALYRQGHEEYDQFEFSQLLTPEERGYLETLKINNTKVPIALENENYPVSFFDVKYGAYQGIAVDILDEISQLAGINFTVVTSNTQTWAQILGHVERGDAALVSELRHSQAREGHFLWTDQPFAISHYALISKINYPNLEMHQVSQKAVGVVNETIFEEVFNQLFPNSTNISHYVTQEKLLDALERGEVDLAMGSEFTLLHQINRREKHEFKINILFDSPLVESGFGFNRNEFLLRGIISKAQKYLDSGIIVRSWTTRIYDVSRQSAIERLGYLSIVTALFFMMLVCMIILFISNKNVKKVSKDQAATISTIYKSLPDMVFSKNRNGEYTSCNHAFEQFLGLSENEIIGKTVLDVYHHDPEMTKSFAEQEQKVMDDKHPITVQTPLVYPDFSKRIFESSYTPLILDGKSVGLLGISRDITEHQVLMEELKEAKDLTELMLDTVPLACLMFDKNSNIITCNSEAVRLFKMKDKQDFIDRFMELSPEYQKDGQRTPEKLEQALKTALDGGKYVFEWMHQLLDGTPMPVLVTLIRVNYHDEEAVCAYVRDMREHKQMMQDIEQQNKLLEAVNRVSATLLVPDSTKFEVSLMQSMGMMAKAINADRVRIWKNYSKNDQLRCTLLHEWVDNSASHIKATPVKDMAYNETIPNFMEMLALGQCINAAASGMPPEAQAQLTKEGILSLFTVPVFVYDTFWGFVGFDDSNEERILTDNEVLILRSASRMIANALIRNEMNNDIRTAARQLQTVVANYPGIIWSIKRDGIVTLFNGTYMDRLGFTDKNIIGEKFYKIQQYPLDDKAKSYIYKSFSEGAQEWISETEDEVLRLRTRPIFHKSEVTDVVGIIDDITQTFRLQRELEIAAEKAQEASSAKSNFLAKMSHEIRTPMNAIIGMAELALREKETGILRRHVHTIKQAGINLLSIVNDILDFSKIESGKFEISKDYYLFSSLINNVISIIRMKTVDSRLRFVVNIDSNIPNELYGDELRIRQVLINVLNNAIKYTEKGFVSLTINGNLIDEETVDLRIDVQDSGKGIKKENIDHLFEDFVQFDPVANKGIEGTGLGLAIVWNVLKAMDGNIKVDSEYGEGSTFTVKLPQKFRSPEKLATVKKPEEKGVVLFEHRDVYADSIISSINNLGVKCTLTSSEDDFCKKMAEDTVSHIFIASTLYTKYKDVIAQYDKVAKIVLLAGFGEASPKQGQSILAMPVYSIPIANVLNGVSETHFYQEDTDTLIRFTAPDAKILIVDDIGTNLRVAEGLMLPYKMHIDLCKSGMEAIEAVRAKQYDLVFMDHRMPEMDGVETVAHIREMGKENRYFNDLPIIALTANAVAGMQDMFLQNGFNGFLGKPIDTSKLNAALEQWIPKEKKENNQMPAFKERWSEVEDIPDAPEIEGLDTNKGIVIAGGSLERYWETLDVFLDDGIEKIEEIKTSMEAGKLPLFTTYVHAMKSAAANVGALQLSASAKDLEMAGKREDVQYIKEKMPVFLEELKSQLDIIRDKLAERDRNGETDDDAETADLKSMLTKLQTAINVLDIGTMNSTIDNLLRLKLPKKMSSGIRNISKSILMAEYDEALDIAGSLLKEVEAN